MLCGQCLGTCILGNGGSGWSAAPIVAPSSATRRSRDDRDEVACDVDDRHTVPTLIVFGTVRANVRLL